MTLLNKMLLTNRSYNTAEDDTLPLSWYSPKTLLRRFLSVKRLEYMNMCSSAGDWQGYIIQRLQGRYYLIPFWQENNYPRAGYTVSTGDVIASSKREFSREFAEEIWESML